MPKRQETIVIEHTVGNIGAFRVTFWLLDGTYHIKVVNPDGGMTNE